MTFTWQSAVFVTTENLSKERPPLPLTCSTNYSRLCFASFESEPMICLNEAKCPHHEIKCGFIRIITCYKLTKRWRTKILSRKIIHFWFVSVQELKTSLNIQIYLFLEKLPLVLDKNNNSNLTLVGLKLLNTAWAQTALCNVKPSLCRFSDSKYPVEKAQP